MPLTFTNGYNWTNGEQITVARLATQFSSATYSGELEVAKGGTGAANAAGARTNLGIGSIATRGLTISTSAPTTGDGVNGDVWLVIP